MAPSTHGKLTVAVLVSSRKTLAAMALLFAVQAFQRPPFMVLDEASAHNRSMQATKFSIFIQRSPTPTRRSGSNSSAAPFDREVDAALDANNVRALSKYVEQVGLQDCRTELRQGLAMPAGGLPNHCHFLEGQINGHAFVR